MANLAWEPPTLTEQQQEPGGEIYRDWRFALARIRHLQSALETIRLSAEEEPQAAQVAAVALIGKEDWE